MSSRNAEKRVSFDLPTNHAKFLKSVAKHLDQGIVDIDNVTFVELLIRTLIDLELSKAVSLCEVLDFWQERSDRMFAQARHFMEVGPWCWYNLGWTGIEDSVQRNKLIIKSRIREIIKGIGRLQMHLSCMKQSCNSGQRDAWMHHALSLSLSHLKRVQPMFSNFADASNIEIPLQPTAAVIKQIGQEIIGATESYQDQMDALLGNCKPAPFIRRYWFVFFFGLPASGIFINWAAKNHMEVSKTLKSMRRSLSLFISEHISQPCRAIYTELFQNTRVNIQDVDALNDSVQSLQRMLTAFVQDRNPNMSASDVELLASSMDMGIVSKEYEKSIVSAMRSIVTGDIVRMLLIQVQFMKTKLLVLLNSMEDLMDENEFNLRIMATIPAFLVFWASFMAVKPFYYAIRKMKSRSATSNALRFTILDMERLLNLRNSNLGFVLNHDSTSNRLIRRLSRGNETLPPENSAEAANDHPVNRVGIDPSESVNVLDELDLGKLALLVHQVRKLIGRRWSRFSAEELKNLDEDLCELMGDRGIVTVGQQLSIVQRIMRTYSFLQLRQGRLLSM